MAETRNFLTRLWHLDNDERPAFLIGDVGPKVKNGKPIKSALFSTEGRDTVKSRLLNPEKYLNAQLQEMKDRSQLKGDYIPTLCPALGVVGIASAFGCEVIWWENDFPAVKPVPYKTPQDIYDLEKPKTTSGELKRILDYTRYFIVKSGKKFPIRLTDIQGPLDNASLIVGHNNLMMAMLSHPEAVHHLMNLVTDLMIDFVKAQKELVEQYQVEFVPTMFEPWMPDGMGISVSNDDWVMISTDMHDNFHVPYLNRLSEEFGGIFIHSCGNWLHQFASLEKIFNLRGIEFGASETSYPAVMDRWNGKTVLACRVGFNRDIHFKSMKDYVQKILKARNRNNGVFINVDITNGVTGEKWPETDLQEIYQLIEN